MGAAKPWGSHVNDVVREFAGRNSGTGASHHALWHISGIFEQYVREEKLNAEDGSVILGAGRTAMRLTIGRAQVWYVGESVIFDPFAGDARHI